MFRLERLACNVILRPIRAVHTLPCNHEPNPLAIVDTPRHIEIVPACHLQRGSHSARFADEILARNTSAPCINNSSIAKLRKPQKRTFRSPTIIASVNWLFRSTTTRRRNSVMPVDIHKRDFFGMGEIIGVLTNPAETVRSLTESRRLLEDARREISENRERAQLRVKHTFSPLPGLFPRQAELNAIEKALLANEPSFTVLFGASSVGKTALLREVLSRDSYHVLHFDLRIAGFADLSSLYMSLSQQMEQYFQDISENMEGYEEFEKEAWSFKHDRLTVERRISEATGSGIRDVKTSDIARLMELFQSSMLKYWEFEPSFEEKKSSESSKEQVSSSSKDGKRSPSRSRWGFRFGKGKEKAEPTSSTDCNTEKQKPPKKMPVIFFDEAHRLPALIQSADAMKCLLDSMIVLTKQDRLCHVIHATSDPFYQTWLRQLNVMQHCKIITIGDCSKAETRTFFRERMLPRVPENLQEGLSFEQLFEAFGGKLAHWHDYITDYINSGGNFEVRQCSHFLQAHALLNLHIIHAAQVQPSEPADNTKKRASVASGNLPRGSRFQIPPLTHPHASSSSVAALRRLSTMLTDNDYYPSEFTAMQLLKIMNRLTQPDVVHLSYFLLCRELGVRSVDGMIKGRILDLRWTDPVTNEYAEESRFSHTRAASSGTAVEGTEDGDMVPIFEGELGHIRGQAYEEMMDIVGPKLVPITPIMRFAMREVLEEYEDQQSVSEYVSLSDVDEY